jgi:NAD(P)-dependent dehydrogenase (short-subunit alcohol dehydrogenase family)
MELEGIAAIVTGGASGLGAATARELVGRGGARPQPKWERRK